MYHSGELPVVGPPKRSGRTASEREMFVATEAGARIDTPIPSGSRSPRSASEIPTTAYFVAAYRPWYQSSFGRTWKPPMLAVFTT